MSTQFGTNKNEFKFETQQAFPIFTGLLVVACIAVYGWSHSPTVRPDWWFQHYAFNPITAMSLFKAQNWADLANLLYGTFSAIPGYMHGMIHLLIGIYFIWVFGTHIEQTLGVGRFLLLAILGATLPWAFVGFDPWFNPSAILVGPAFLTATILGAYLVFPPERKKIQGWMPRPRNEIFRKEEKKDMTKKYAKDPSVFIWLFIGVMFAGHFGVVFLTKGQYDVVAVVPFVAALGIGYVMAMMLVYSATGSIKDAPIKLAAMKHYRDLLDLDVNHDEALRGTARALGLPYEQVKDWVQKDRGKMRVK